MRRPLPLPFIFITCALAMGCTGPKHTAKYGWLRKQGPVTVQRIAAPEFPSPAAGEMETAETAATAWECSVANSSVPAIGKRSDRVPLFPVLVPSSPVPAMSVVAPPDTTNYYSPEQHRWNIKALSSLPIAIVAVVVGVASQSLWILLIGGAIAFTLGLIGSRQCRDREDRGKGFAIAGMVLGTMTLFFGLMGLLW